MWPEDVVKTKGSILTTGEITQIQSLSGACPGVLLKLKQRTAHWLTIICSLGLYAATKIDAIGTLKGLPRLLSNLIVLRPDLKLMFDGCLSLESQLESLTEPIKQQSGQVSPSPIQNEFLFVSGGKLGGKSYMLSTSPESRVSVVPRMVNTLKYRVGKKYGI